MDLAPLTFPPATLDRVRGSRFGRAVAAGVLALLLLALLLLLLDRTGGHVDAGDGFAVVAIALLAAAVAA